MPGGSVDKSGYLPAVVPNHVVIGDDSIFRNINTFIAMPDLRAFANAGFPFSRMADLFDTLAVMLKHPNRSANGNAAEYGRRHWRADRLSRQLIRPSPMICSDSRQRRRRSVDYWRYSGKLKR